MVLVPFPDGMGARERGIYMYFWDERDGGDWSGWWVTPDYKGNNEFYLHAAPALESRAPADVPIGEWHSPLVEMQMKRALRLGFVETPDGLIASGDDAATAIVPDQVSKLQFSKYIFKLDGLHHGRPAYVAHERPKLPEPTAQAQRLAISPATYIGVGVGIGVLAAFGASLAARRL
mmetsp:Transcript_48887/g.104365  ORF Transcript_48887/g.104365 Transcript_48887/m.104365 type:complete len:176 (-) Transcript_48887:44-571(-)|eukprot:CAMPEP_0183360348 /NCGR_PEP_ID=MMETSP0164_2-20130417/54965_1 /TAXON_ID=221442 /ORGANISM="Coccolithus pelagicus ssp braarudi, Strain PLY182g" /LENGTH=175 /DNA_ID=CAMNT_0025534687 /DNA_START=57 /DNA_END=584 /DNA_ORIENTATION=+